MRRVIALSTAIVATWIGLVAQTGVVPARATGTVDRIAFSRRVGESSPDIITVKPDGSDPMQVPLGEPAETFAIPVWSPDRSHLLISNLDRGEEEPLEFPPATVRPDGSDFNIVVAHAEGSDVTYCSAWTTDGQRLLCAIGGSDVGVPAGVGSIRASDGGDFKRLTTDPFQNSSDIPTDVSPDGMHVVFMRFRPGPLPDRTQQSALFVVDVDGGGVRQLTPYGLTFPHIEFASAQWSPDGQEIISSTPRGTLFVVRVDGTGIRPIQLDVGTQRYFASEPDWSPDGSQIVFGMFLNGQEDLFTANADGSDVVQITDTPEFENGPDWGPPLS